MVCKMPSCVVVQWSKDSVEDDGLIKSAALSGYGFCRSHATAFALIDYQTLYLKVHYPAAFYCACSTIYQGASYARRVVR